MAEFNTDLNIKYPYFLYPGYPFRGGYTKFELYRSETCKLFDYINNYKIQNKTLFHLTIGAAMEEVIDALEYDVKQQWRQLLPQHVDIWAAYANGLPIDIVIVSPNVSFSDEEYIDPIFISKTQEKYEWIKIENRKYKSEKFNINIDIFCTMFPHIDPRNNILIEKAINIKNIDQYYPYIDDARQTDKDKIFVNKFYKNLDTLFCKIKEKQGIVTCFSFAVFNNKSCFNKYNDYKMISEIKKLFDMFDIETSLLCEWVHDINNTNMLVYNKVNVFFIKKKKLYIDYTDYNYDSAHIIVKLDSSYNKLCIELL
jgi:hypothetical protein